MVNYKQNKSELFLLLILCISVLIGFYLRIKGLSYGGFTNSDEYYIAKSVHNILKYGVPKYPLGGYYPRGLIYQYLSALLLSAGVKEVFALRIIPLIFNMLAIPAIYLLGKKLGGKIIAVFIVVLFSFSILEIEYSRLARYYTPFQTLFIWYIYFLYRVVKEKDLSSFKWMLILSITSVFMYEGSIFMVILNFVPFIFNKVKLSISKITIPIIIFITAFLYLSFDFRNFNVTNYLPKDINLTMNGSFLPIDIPHLFIQTFSNFYWYILFIIPIAFCTFYGIYLFKNNKDKRINFIFLFLALLSLFNLYGVIFISFLIFYLINWIRFEDLRDRRFYVLIAVLFLNFVFYLTYGMISISWIRFFPEESSISINKIFWVFINYPNFYEKIFLPWFLPMPKFTALCFLFISGGVIINFFKSIKENKAGVTGINFLLAIVIFLISLVGILKTQYNDARYTFFLFPLVLVIVLISMKIVAEFLVKKEIFKNAALIIFIILFVAISTDYYPYHLLHISSKEVRYRTIYNHRLANIYYYDEDYTTPAMVMNKKMKSSDVVITTQATIEYYLKRLDYDYINYEDAEFPIRARLKGKKEVWTNANLIYTKRDLLDLLKNSKSTVWLSDFSDKRYGVSPLEMEINKEFKKYLYYVNIDSTVNVFKIPPKESH